MRRNLSLILSLIFIISFTTAVISAANVINNEWTPTETSVEPLEKDEDTVARFAIGSDVHMCKRFYSYDKLKNLYNVLGQIGGVDALMIVGDAVDSGTEKNYDMLMELVTAGTENATVDVEGADIVCTGNSVGTTVISLGNHEYSESGKLDAEALFREKTGQELNTFSYINGVPVLKLSPSEANGNKGTSADCYTDKLDLIRSSFEQIDESGYEGPVIVLGHHPLPTTGSDDVYTDEIMEIFRAHPNVIFFSAHAHSIIYNLSLAINQDQGFTHVRCGVIGRAYGGYFTDPVTGERVDGYYKNCAELSSNIWIVDIKSNGEAQLRLFNLAKGKFEFENEEFIISGDMEPYYLSGSDEGYGAKSLAPVFPEGSGISWTTEDGSDSIDLTVPAASAATGLACDMIFKYTVTVNGPYIGTVTYDYMADFLEDSSSDTLTFKIQGLLPGKKHHIKVAAVTSYGVSSEILSISDVTPGVPLPFSDVLPSDWFYDPVKYVYGKGMMNGTSDTVFSPGSGTTRAMLVTVLYRLEGSPAVSATSPFTDLKQEWYLNAVNWAYENDIVNGMSKTVFDPSGYITREQTAAIIYRYSVYKSFDVSGSGDLSSYKDRSEISSWATDAMRWANGEGIITGMTDTILSPGGRSTRAQLATILYRFCLKYVQTEDF